MYPYISNGMVGVRRKNSNMQNDQPTKTLPKISNKQQEILKFIYHFRFLNRIQIQTLLNHKDHKTINLWLKDLTEKEYINRIYSTKFGENTKPAVYYIGANGIKFLKALVDCPKEQVAKLHREKDRLNSFIANCQFLADIYIELRNRNTGEMSYTVSTSAVFLNPNSPYHFLANSHIDLVVGRKQTANGGMKKYYLLEIIGSTLPGYSVRKRIKDYFDFYFSNDWEDNVSNTFPTIILVFETLPAMLPTKKLVNRLREENDNLNDLHIRFATTDEIKERGVTGEIWEEVK